VARVTLVVNSAREGSETFLHGLTAILGSEGHQVTLHELMPDAALMSADGAEDGYGCSVERSRALPPARSVAFAGALARLGAGQRAVAQDVLRRSLSRFGRTPRAAKAALLAAPLLATRPDVVHFSFSPIGVALLDAIELLDPRIRVVVSCRGTGELVRPVLDDEAARGLAQLLQRADAVHAVSDCIAATVTSLAPDTPVHVVRPAIDLDRFTRHTPRRPIGSPLQVVTVSRLHWIKAVDVQLSAAASLRRRGLDLHWTIVGDGPERDLLRFRAHALGVDDVVTFAGATAPARVRELVEGADVFVLSSLSEGTSNSVLEAMALEVPVVSTSVGGMPEVLTDGVDAVLVPPGDADSLGAAILRLTEDEEAAGAMAARGRRTVSEGFSTQRQAQQFGVFYRSVLDGPGAPEVGR